MLLKCLDKGMEFAKGLRVLNQNKRRLIKKKKKKITFDSHFAPNKTSKVVRVQM